MRQHPGARLFYSQTAFARRARRAIAGMAIIVGLIALRLPIQSLAPHHSFRKDFLQEYLLARAIAEGTNPYLHTETLALRYLGKLPETLLQHPTPHPPPLGLILLPVAALSYPTAAGVWFVFELICLISAVRALARATGARLSWPATLAVTIALLGWFPVFSELVLGQLMIPLLALLALAWLALASGRPTVGGVLVGLSMLVKPVAAPLFLLFAVRTDWRPLAGASAVTLGGYLIAAWLLGWSTLTHYLTTVLPLVTDSYRAHAANSSVASIGWRLFDGTGSPVLLGFAAPPLAKCPSAARALSIVLPLGVLTIAGLAVRRHPNPDHAFAAMICVSILVSPISWNHYPVLTLIPGALVLRWIVCHRLPAKQTNWILGVFLLLAVNWVRPPLWLVAAAPANGEASVPFALGLLTMIPAVAVAALAWLVLSLDRGGPEQRPQSLVSRAATGTVNDVAPHGEGTTHF